MFIAPVRPALESGETTRQSGEKMCTAHGIERIANVDLRNDEVKVTTVVPHDSTQPVNDAFRTTFGTDAEFFFFAAWGKSSVGRRVGTAVSDSY